MGIFSGIGSIVGGAAGADDQAPNITDFFDPAGIFGGLKAGGFRIRFKKGTNRLVVKPGPRAIENRRQLRGIVRRSRSVDRAARGERRNLNSVRQNLLGLRDQVRPGFGRLTEARVKAIDRAEAQALGNLREQFGARNVLGSSFAAREQAGVVAEFGDQEEEARAQAIIEEISATLGIDRELMNVSGQQAQLLAVRLQGLATRLSAVQSKINADFTELGIAAGLKQHAMDLALDLAKAQAGLEAAAARDRGESLSNIFGGIDQIVGGGSLFGGGSIFK